MHRYQVEMDIQCRADNLSHLIRCRLSSKIKTIQMTLEKYSVWPLHIYIYIYALFIEYVREKKRDPRISS